MSSNLPPSKLAPASNQASSPSTQGPTTSSIDSAQRRFGGSGSHGAGASSRSGNAAPRNKQTSKNQNKQSRRFKVVDEDAIAESAAMRSTSNRKGQTSITHLMNFSLPPRPTYQNYHSSTRNTTRRNPTWGLGSGYHSVDKARYVHANYRFIVDPRRDYHAQSVDADVYLDWGSILQILASPISQESACPICLGEPVAPRMAKCGHIFCLHCLIRFMHSNDDSQPFPEKKARWKACPICWDSVYISETRPVRWYRGQEGDPPREGGDIVLRLVLRSAGSTLALPKEGVASMSKDEDIPWHFAADVMDYSRVMKGTEDYMLEQYNNEIRELEQLEKHDELMFGEDTEWTGRAIRSVKEAKERLNGVGNAPGSSVRPEDSKINNPPPKSEDIAQNNSLLSQSLAEIRESMPFHHATSDYYFYQALLHYYLSPLDIRILKAAFGDFSLFPSTILPRIERISSGHVIDDDLRKRAKYLAHLPHGCEVSFLECDWTDTVPAEVLEKFSGDIDRRRKRNSEKDAREEKDRIRAEKEEDDKRWAAARRKPPSSPSNAVRFRDDEFAPLGSTPNASNTATPPGMESTSPAWGSSRNGASFASLASPSTSPSQSRTVWGTAAVTPMSPSLPAQQEPVDDGWLQGWEKDLLAEDDMVVAQMESLGIAGDEPGSSSSAVAAAAVASAANSDALGNSSNAKATPSGGGKKKKGKKITLMSTNARRGA